MSKKDWKKHFHRMKQIADQNLGRAEKSEVLNEDLVLLEKRVNKIKAICQGTIKKLAACLPLSASSNPDKSLKKLPESALAMTMMEAATALGCEDTLGKTYSYCAKLQSCLAREMFRYTQQIEKLVLSPIQSVLETEIPTIVKLRKQLTKLTLDMDSAKGRFQSMLKQSYGSSSSSLASKVETLKNEMEQAETRVQQCRDQLIIEMYSFLAREGQLSDVLMALISTQIDFHRRTLESLENSLPQMKLHTESSIYRPVFGCPLVSHLEHTNHEIAVVIEKCVHSLILHGINEEGLFRVASSSTKVKKLKAGFDANIVNMDDYREDSHCVAAVLKSYLRELPEPLMTFELYSEWMHIMELPTELRQNALWVVVDKLPKPNYNNLRYIIKFLAKLAANSDVNKMSSSNISIVIGPNLLWPSGDDGPSVLTATSHSAIIECLINKSEWFFPGELDFGVTETDHLKLFKSKLNDNPSPKLSSVSSSVLTPSYISKHRFFGNIFDETDSGGLKMSPSNTRLSLNSLTSLNDNESGFERKYSFSSLLEERMSNWDSEGSSIKWRKMTRVESGTSSLNNSFCYTNNRSPLSSSLTSPALSSGNTLSVDVPGLFTSVTKSPTLSVSTSSVPISGSSLMTATNAGSGLSPTAGMQPCLTNVTSESSGSENPKLSVTRDSELKVTADSLLSVSKVNFSLSSADGTSSESNSPLILVSPFLQFSGISTASGSKAAANSSLPTSDSAADFSVTLTENSSVPVTNASSSSSRLSPTQLNACHTDSTNYQEPVTKEQSSEVLVTLPEVDSSSFLPETCPDFGSNLPSRNKGLAHYRSASGESCDEFYVNNSCKRSSVVPNGTSSSVVNGTAESSVGQPFEKSPYLQKFRSKFNPAARGAPGKERVKIHGNFQRVDFIPAKEKNSERRLSTPASRSGVLATNNPKQPVKKSRSLSVSSVRAVPYDVQKTTLLNPNCRKSLPPRSEVQDLTILECNSMTPEHGSTAKLCAENNVIFSYANSVISTEVLSLTKSDVVANIENMTEAEENAASSGYGMTVYDRCDSTCDTKDSVSSLYDSSSSDLGTLIDSASSSFHDTFAMEKDLSVSNSASPEDPPEDPVSSDISNNRSPLSTT